MEMKLMTQYFNFIKNGTKRIELRLNDEKRRTIQIGDIVVFLNESNNEEKITVKVTGLLKYSSFLDLINDYEIELLADKSITKQKLIETLNQFYSKEDQDRYGVLGIKIELLNRENKIR